MEDLKLRKLKDLYVTSQDTTEEVAENIASTLSEPNKDLIYKIVSTLGTVKAIEFYDMTKHIEDHGGMLTKNGSRRKTSGGIFFHLVNQDLSLPKEILKEIFSDNSVRDRQRKNQEIRERRKLKNLELRERLLREGLLTTLPDSDE